MNANAIAPDLKSALDIVLADVAQCASRRPTNASEAHDVALVQAAMKEWAIELTYGEGYHLWSLVSLDCQQNWNAVGDEADVRASVAMLCEHVRDGCDYAGLSRS